MPYKERSLYNVFDGIQVRANEMVFLHVLLMKQKIYTRQYLISKLIEVQTVTE